MASPFEDWASSTPAEESFSAWAGAPAAAHKAPTKPSYLQYVSEPARNFLEWAGKSVLGAYEGLDPTKAQSALQAGMGPVGAAFTAPSIIGEFAGETTRRATELLGPNISAAAGTAANLYAMGKVPLHMRGASAERPSVPPPELNPDLQQPFTELVKPSIVTEQMPLPMAEQAGFPGMGRAPGQASLYKPPIPPEQQLITPLRGGATQGDLPFEQTLPTPQEYFAHAREQLELPTPGEQGTLGKPPMFGRPPPTSDITSYQTQAADRGAWQPELELDYTKRRAVDEAYEAQVRKLSGQKEAPPIIETQTSGGLRKESEAKLEAVLRNIPGVTDEEIALAKRAKKDAGLIPNDLVDAYDAHNIALDMSRGEVERKLFAGHAWRQITNVFRDFGGTTKYFANELHRFRDGWQRETGTDIAAVKDATRGFSQAEALNMRAAIEGKAAPLNEQVAAATKVVQDLFENKGNRAEKLQLPIYDPIDDSYSAFTKRANYFPHYDMALELGKKVDERSILNSIQKEAASRGKVISDAQANRVLEFMRRNTRTLDGHLQISRTYEGAPKSVTPINDIIRYVESANRRIWEAEVFGADVKKGQLADMLGKIRKERGDQVGDVAQLVFDRQVGREKLSPTAEMVSQLGAGFRGLTLASKMGLSFIRNANQPVLTMMATDIKSFSHAFADILRSSTREEATRFALESSAILDSTLRQVAHEAGLTHALTSKDPGAAAGFARFGAQAGQAVLEKLTPFQRVEYFNRLLTANTGKYYLQSLVRKLEKSPTSLYLRSEISKLGHDPEMLLKNGITREDTRIAGQRLVERTQFKTDPIDLPLAATDPYLRNLYMLKSFSFKAAQLFVNEAKTNPRFYLRGLLYAPLTGEVTNNLIDLFSGRDPATRGQENFALGKLKSPEGVALNRYLGDMFQVGYLGILSDVVMAGMHGAQGAVGFLGGPLLQQAAGVVQAIKDLSTGQPTKAVEFAARQVPVIGPFVGAKIKEARTKKEGLQQMQQARPSSTSSKKDPLVKALLGE